MQTGTLNSGTSKSGTSTSSTSTSVTSNTGTGTGKAVLVAVVVPVARLAQTGAKQPGGATSPLANKTRVADALRKAAQSSPAAQAAFRRNPAAVKKIATHAQKLPADPARSPLAALKQGLGVSGGLGSLRRDMRKDFRKGGGEVKRESSHGLSERGQRHADAAERGLRRGGLGLLSAAWHGTRIMREQRKTLNRERADARAEAKASGKPLPPEGMRALLGSAVKGVGIARGLRAGLSEMRTQERARERGQGQDSVRGGSDVRTLAAIDLRQPRQGQGEAPRVLRATGFALGAMALHANGGGQTKGQIGFLLLGIQPGQTGNEEAHG